MLEHLFLRISLSCQPNDPYSMLLAIISLWGYHLYVLDAHLFPVLFKLFPSLFPCLFGFLKICMRNLVFSANERDNFIHFFMMMFLSHLDNLVQALTPQEFESGCVVDALTINCPVSEGFIHTKVIS